jgi:hypothetical protein
MKYLKRFNEGTLDSMSKPEIVEELYDISYELKDEGFDINIEEYYWQPTGKQYIICRILQGGDSVWNGLDLEQNSQSSFLNKDEVNESLIDTTLRIIDYMYQKSYDLGTNKWAPDCEGKLRVKRKVSSGYYTITKEELNEFIGVDFEIIELVFVPII